MNDLEKKILNRIQDDFPLTKRPYRQLADEVGCSETEVLRLIHQFKEDGLVRRLGASFASDKLGYASTLVALKAPVERVDAVAAVINSYPQVTHNYLREHDYNIWFTVIAANFDRVKEIVVDIGKETGIDAIIILPASKLFKIKVNFSL